MTAYIINESHAAIALAINERTMRAYRLHPEKLSFIERMGTVGSEFDEVIEAYSKGDYVQTLYELLDLATTVCRAIEEMRDDCGVGL